ncbi:hypothetical protein [Candidatus Solincola tengchongensis]|uniref:hypothetical protein n=1 Tax=Candidatus Solincola tengchongensis TaxID=2900693 RepID=UPI00257D337E|nr:hypothetical protein [Candidatus Solincola tengchongensis]
MEAHELFGGEERDGRVPRTSFFTRKLATKFQKMGIDIPASVMAFLDTPLCAFDEEQARYFEEKFRPLIPRLISILEEVYDELGADREGWEDMLTYNVRQETPIGICARAVLVKKERSAEDILTRALRDEQRTRRLERPPCFSRPGV